MGCHQEQTVTCSTQGKDISWIMNVKHTATSLCPFCTLCLIFMFTHPGQDRNPISCPRQSCQWYCTTTCHLLVPHWCRSHTLFPGTQRGSGRALPLNCHRLQRCLRWQETTVRTQSAVASLHTVYMLWFLSLTSTGTESILLVLVKVACGGTPAVTITAALCGTFVKLLVLKDEGEDTLSSVWVSSNCVENCREENWGQGWAGEASRHVAKANALI